MAQWTDVSHLRVTVMGLGLNGGGLATTQFFARRGAQVTVTDLRDEKQLEPSIQALEGLNIRYVLGRHDEEDFRQADLVIKNPAVRVDNPFLKLARRVETDLSVFLSAVDNPVLGVTGSKGKSSTASALHHILKAADPRSRIGGNITVSPLSFIDEIEPGAPLVLELSSWQLADLRGKGVLSPRCAAVTNLLWDHMNVYKDFEDYALDKAEIFAGQASDGWSLCNYDQEWGPWMAQRTPAQVAAFSAQGRPEGTFAARIWLEGPSLTARGWAEKEGLQVELLPEKLRVPGRVFRGNCLMAAALAWLYGLDAGLIRQALADFPGIEHRMEHFHTSAGVRYYNDTAATIPEASTASVRSFEEPVHWITGGTDKNLDLESFRNLDQKPASLILLQGTATERMVSILREKGWTWDGPFDNLEAAVSLAVRRARSGEVVLLSPGATSFEMFKNEFDRGNQFKNLVRRLATEEIG